MNCEARVLFVKDFLQLGLALIEGSKAAVCLFRGCQFIRPRGNLDSMSQWLSEGTKLRVHAKKESNSKMVAYLATSVWFEDEDYEHENVNSLYYPTDPENLETYNRVADDLTWGIKATVSAMHKYLNILGGWGCIGCTNLMTVFFFLKLYYFFSYNLLHFRIKN